MGVNPQAAMLETVKKSINRQAITSLIDENSVLHRLVIVLLLQSFGYSYWLIIYSYENKM